MNVVRFAQSKFIQSTADSLAEEESLEFERISKTILKLYDPGILNRALTPETAVSQEIVETMRHLVAIVAKVRSPEGGWPLSFPQTPENLLPYVSEEVYEVLESLKQGKKEKGNNPLNKSRSSSPNSRYILVEELIPKLLWYMARSSENVMRLLAGVQAKVCSANGEASAGMVRLAAILQANADNLHWSMDLTTQQPLRSRLPSDATIQLNDRKAWNQAIPSGIAPLHAVDTFRQQLRQEILCKSPQLLNVLESIRVDALEPGKLWQSGTIQLSFDFEFIATEGETDSEGAIELSENYPSKLSNLQIFEAPQTKILFGDPTFLEQYSQNLIEQHLIGAIDQMEAIAEQEKIDETNSPTSEVSTLLSDLIYSLIKTAYILADLVPTPTAAELPGVWQIGLDELTHRLLWQLVGSSYEIMQLVGGIEARVLQPESNWLAGTLRLLVKLKATAADLNWDVDISTGQVPPSNCWTLPANAIVQSNSSRLLREPTPVENLLIWLRKQTRKMTPKIQLLMEGTQVEFLESDRDWQSVFLELSFDLELMP